MAAECRIRKELLWSGFNKIIRVIIVSKFAVHVVAQIPHAIKMFVECLSFVLITKESKSMMCARKQNDSGNRID